MVQNGIARFDIAQKIDKRDLVGLRTRERAHNEVEISRGEARPTIRPDHRDFIMRKRATYGKHTLFSGEHRPLACSCRQLAGNHLLRRCARELQTSRQAAEMNTLAACAPQTKQPGSLVLTDTDLNGVG